MNESVSYLGCPVILNNEESDFLVRTKIVDYDKALNIITIEGKISDLITDPHINLLIMTPKGIHEYRGTFRRETEAPSTTEIAMYKGKVIENRITRRYQINTPGKIENIIVNNVLTPLPKPIEVFIVNISTQGILFQIKSAIFHVNSMVEAKIATESMTMVLKVLIVRMNILENKMIEYGCELCS